MAVISHGTLRESIEARRFDAEFFHPEFMAAAKALSRLRTTSLAQHFQIADGNHLSVSQHFSHSHEIPYYRGQDITDFFIENTDPMRISQTLYDSPLMRRSHFRADDVLLSIVGTIGSLCFVPETLGPATGSCKIAILRAKGSYSPRLLTAFLMSRFGQSQIRRHTRGAVQMGLILADLPKLLIPLFPEEEAEIISNWIDEALVANRNSKSAHTQAQQLLESELGLDKLEIEKPVGYTARFSELEESRRADAQHYQPHFAQLMRTLERHNPTRLRAIRTLNRRGIQPEYVEGGEIAAINSQHLGPHHLAYDSFARTSRKWFDLSPVAHVQPGDLLIYTTGAYVGRTNVYLDNQPALASNHVNILRLTPGIDAAYMALVLQSKVGQFQTAKHARGSAQAELYPADIDKFLVPLLPASLQAEIGDLVRTSLKKQRESQSLLDQAKARVEQLIEEAVAKS